MEGKAIWLVKAGCGVIQCVPCYAQQRSCQLWPVRVVAFKRSKENCGFKNNHTKEDLGLIEWCSATLPLFSKNPAQVVYGNHEGITLVPREYIGIPNYIVISFFFFSAHAQGTVLGFVPCLLTCNRDQRFSERRDQGRGWGDRDFPYVHREKIVWGYTKFPL